MTIKGNKWPSDLESRYHLYTIAFAQPQHQDSRRLVIGMMIRSFVIGKLQTKIFAQERAFLSRVFIYHEISKQKILSESIIRRAEVTCACCINLASSVLSTRLAAKTCLGSFIFCQKIKLYFTLIICANAPVNLRNCPDKAVALLPELQPRGLTFGLNVPRRSATLITVWLPEIYVFSPASSCAH